MPSNTEWKTVCPAHVDFFFVLKQVSVLTEMFCVSVVKIELCLWSIKTNDLWIHADETDQQGVTDPRSV